MNNFTYWMVEDSYPGLAARYPIVVVPGDTREEAETLVKQLGLLKPDMPFHIREATRTEIVDFIAKTIDELARAKVLSLLMPYFDLSLTKYFPDA